MRITYFAILIFGVVVAVTNSAVVPDAAVPAVSIESESDTPIADDDFVLPKGILTCDQDDPELNQCIKNTINQQLPLLHKGSLRLNIPPLDPLRIPDGRYGYSGGPVGGVLILKGANLYGISKSTIKKVDTKILADGVTSTMVSYFPRILVDGNYKADVKFNELKMRPKGHFNLTLTDVTLKAKMTGQFKTVDGKKYLQLNSVEAEPEIGNLRIFATGLFPDPILNNVVLDFANQYWPEIVKTVVPQTKSTWEPIVLDTANKFLSAVPFESLLRKSSTN